MNRDEDAVTGPTVGNPPLVFPSIEAAMAHFARLNNPPRFGLDRERAVQALIKIEHGYMLKRDPDNANRKPIGEGTKLPRRPVREMWAELAMVKAPTILVRGLQSDRYPPENGRAADQGIPADPPGDGRNPSTTFRAWRRTRWWRMCASSSGQPEGDGKTANSVTAPPGNPDPVITPRGPRIAAQAAQPAPASCLKVMP